MKKLLNITLVAGIVIVAGLALLESIGGIVPDMSGRSIRTRAREKPARPYFLLDIPRESM